MVQKTMGEAPPITAEGFYNAKLKDITEKPMPSGSNMLNWKFEILEGPEATSVTGRYAWGKCWDDLDNRPGCVWKNWHEALIDRPLEVGETVRTEDVISMLCQIEVRHRRYLPKGKPDKPENYELTAEVVNVYPISAELSTEPPF